MFDTTKILATYFEHFPDDQLQLELLSKQAGLNQPLNDRTNHVGHITGAAIVLSPDHSKILMIHHGVHGRWMQPGGHWDEGESDPLHAAKREAEEETQIEIARYLPLDNNQPHLPLHISTHFIPDRPSKREPEHYHHDFRYVFEAKQMELRHQALEVNAAAWFALDAPEVRELSEVIERVRQYILV